MEKILLTVFMAGSAVGTIEKNSSALEAELRASLPERAVYRAFTGRAAIQKFCGSDGVPVRTVEETVQRLSDEGAEDVLVQPAYVLPGLAYDRLCAQLGEASFGRLRLSAPLLTDEEDCYALAKVLIIELPVPQTDTVLIFAGHGTEHRAAALYVRLERCFHELGRRDVYVGTLWGDGSLAALRREICSLNRIKHVVLLPLMFTAGVHACRDLAGTWKNAFQRDGYDVSCVLRGLGESPAVRRLFVEKARAAEREGDTL